MSLKGFELKRSSQKTWGAPIVAALLCINLAVPFSASAADEIRTIELEKKVEVSVKPGSIVRLKFKINVETPFSTSVRNLKTVNNTEGSCEDLSSVKLEYMEENFQSYWTFKNAKCTGMGWDDSPNNNSKGRFLGFHSIYIKSGSKDKTETYQVYVHQDLAPKVLSVGEKGVDLPVTESGCFRSDCFDKTLEVQVTMGHNYTFKFISEISPADLWLTAKMNPPFGNSVNCDRYTCLINNGEDWEYSPTVSGKFFIILGGVHPRTGPTSIQTLRVVVVDKNGASTITPTPKATSASPSPTPTKTTSPNPTATIKPVVKNPATKIPFKVELRYAGGVDTSSGDLSKSANISGNTEWVYLNYHGDLNDKKTKPTGLRFYIKDATNNIRTLIGAVALTTTRDVTGNEKPTCSLAKGKSVTYDCRVSFNPESNGITPKSKILLYAAPYNSAGESSTLRPISLFPIMDRKAFIACLENGVSEAKKELTAVFVGIALDTGASATTDSLKIGNKVWEQGTEATISLRLKQMASPTEDLKNLKDVAASTSMSVLNKWLFGNAELKISAKLIAKGATLSATAIGGVISAVDIIVAGQKAQYRISDCESNNPN